MYRILRDFQERGTWEQVHDALHKAVREAEGKEAAPTAVIVDSQSVKCGGQKGGIAATMPARKSGAASGTSSFDTLGLIAAVVVHGADIQDREGARLVLPLLRSSQPFIQKMFADGGYTWRRACP